MGLQAVPLGNGDQLIEFFLSKCLMRPDILPVVKKLASNKDNALLAP